MYFCANNVNLRVTLWAAREKSLKEDFAGSLFWFLEIIYNIFHAFHYRQLILIIFVMLLNFILLLPKN